MQLQDPTSWNEQHEGRLTAMLDGGQQAAEVTLQYFGDTNLGVEAKADDSPVTIADRKAEANFRDFLSKHFPQDSLLGEEHGTIQGSSRYRWIIDPIDGTKSFIGGVPLYSTLLALELDETPVAGAIWIPALGELVFAATDLGCWHRKPSQSPWSQAKVSTKNELSTAIMLTTAVDSFEQVSSLDQFLELQKQVWFTRTWGDGYGYLLVATGRADVMIDPIVSPWDVAAIRPVIEQAGGRFTDWTAKATTKSNNAVGSNGLLHDKILAALNQ